MGGDMGDVPSAANDPIFYLHHSFIDLIFEKWLKTYKQNATILSPYDAPFGHNKGDVIIPMFPVYTHEQMFKRSQEFGYSYEGIDEIGTYTVNGDYLTAWKHSFCKESCFDGELTENWHNEINK